MSFSPSSRYTLTTDSDGRAVSKRKAQRASRVVVIMAVEGQTFDELAAMHLGDSQLYWRIAELNPHVPYPDTLSAGTRIRIPQG
jgi:hypothetical protein